ncbi:DUF2076 domain-containing protein [Microvirga pudoricolor]|uniref:DUF2076 domain-containing protein n=1 Tax=Microvirga pudoricolor TaxID=2778729 RepID=UPI00194DE2E1|nr:DUF2076 family protein [Microvirga pudoricolor]MBM6593224.1 DUF2076 domain-containing protein [Microvirga pudoricolor]
MNHQDRHAIEQLFGKLAQVETQASAPDAEAASLIRSQIAQQPQAPYFMAQTIIVQEQALSAAQGRIQQLEQQIASRPAGGGGFLSGLFGGGAQPAQRQPQANPMMQPGQPSGPWGGAPGAQPGMVPGRGGGGGFLAGAAQTAMGVAGGVMLGNMLMGAFGGDDAKTADAAGAQPEPEQTAAADEGGGMFDGFFGGEDEA